MAERDIDMPTVVGTMIEVPRAALTADDIAEYADFFSFGTNDLTQTTFGMSRDDAETSFLIDYLETGVFATNPFATLDRQGRRPADRASALSRPGTIKPDLDAGICGEHGGDPASIALARARADLRQLLSVPCARRPARRSPRGSRCSQPEIQHPEGHDHHRTDSSR